MSWPFAGQRRTAYKCEYTEGVEDSLAGVQTGTVIGRSLEREVDRISFRKEPRRIVNRFLTAAEHHAR